MAKEKFTGAGAIVEVDIDGLPTWSPVGCTINITAPPQSKAQIDTTCQQDTAASAVTGIEETSEAQFEEGFDHAFNNTIIDAFYDSGAVKDWRITYVNDTASMVIVFPARVSALTPASAGGSDFLTRTVTLLRDGPIVYNPA